MEFRTNSQFANNGINMRSPIVGGVGYNPTPSNFCYNGDGVGKYTSNPDPCQPPAGFMNPPGGYVTSYNPYAMNYGYYQQQVGPILIVIYLLLINFIIKWDFLLLLIVMGIQ